MHVRLAWTVRLGIVALAIWTALSLTRGQEQQSTPHLSAGSGKATATPAKTPVEAPRDFSNLAPLQKQVWLSAQRGATWLHRANGPDGRFAPGVVPALRIALEGDH